MSPVPVPWAAIEALSAAHAVADFTCGHPDADEWIQAKASGQAGRIATHVATSSDGVVVGYFSLKTVAVLGGEMSKSLKGSADNKTAFLLCWIAVHADHQRGGHFARLLHESWRVAAAADALSPVELFVLDPLTDKLAAKYSEFGLIPIKPGSSRMGIKMSKVRAILDAL